MSRFPNGYVAGACLYAFILCLSLVLLVPGLVSAQTPCPTIEVCFSPLGGCMASIVREIDSSKKEINVQAYSIDSVSIQKALISAHKRGVEVNIILDKKRGKAVGKEADTLKEAGLWVKIDLIHSIAHDKIMVVDGGCVITGSYNFSEKGDKSNAENILIIRDLKTASQYSGNWSKHWAHSDEYVFKGVQ